MKWISATELENIQLSEITFLQNCSISETAWINFIWDWDSLDAEAYDPPEVFSAIIDSDGKEKKTIANSWKEFCDGFLFE